MNRNIAMATGWVLAIALGAALYTQVQTNRALALQRDAALASAATLEEAAARVSALEAQCAALEATVAKLEEASSPDLEAAGEAREALHVPEGFDPKALLQNMFGGDTSDEPGETTKPENPFAAMFEGEEGAALLETMLPAQVDMQYSELFTQLGLSEEKRAALRGLLLDHARAGAAAGMAMMRGEDSADTDSMPSEDDLLAAVGEVLSPEEMAQFSEYQAELPERMMRQQFEMQINMMAGDLPEDVRALTVDVLVENLAATQSSDLAAPPDFGAMRAAFDNSIATLDETLAPEYRDRVRSLIEQQRAGIAMAERMFGGNREDAEAP